MAPESPIQSRGVSGLFSPAGWWEILAGGAGLASLAVVRTRQVLGGAGRAETLRTAADDVRTTVQAGLARVAPLASAFDVRDRVAAVAQAVRQLNTRLALSQKLSPITASLQAVDRAVTNGRLAAAVAAAYAAAAA
eukprot:EG_transcript_46938